MKTLKNTDGFSAAHALLVLVVVGIIGFIGWFVWNTNHKTSQTPKPIGEASPKEALMSGTELKKNSVPDGWVKYSNTENKISFYHPAIWNNTEITVDAYDISADIPSKYGTPDSIVYDKQTKSWIRYINYGTREQQKQEAIAGDSYAIKTTNSAHTSVPVAYYKTGHAAVVTHDILIVNDQNIFRIRLPEINTFNNDWESGLEIQTESLPDLVTSIRFE